MKNDPTRNDLQVKSHFVCKFEVLVCQFANFLPKGNSMKCFKRSQCVSILSRLHWLDKKQFRNFMKDLVDNREAFTNIYGISKVSDNYLTKNINKHM